MPVPERYQGFRTGAVRLVALIRWVVRLRSLEKSDGMKGRRLPRSDQAGAPTVDPIAFFNALQIISREKGFCRKSKILSFSALDATKVCYNRR
jgi:hypothetical protein